MFTTGFCNQMFKLSFEDCAVAEQIIQRDNTPDKRLFLIKASTYFAKIFETSGILFLFDNTTTISLINTLVSPSGIII